MTTPALIAFEQFTPHVKAMIAACAVSGMGLAALAAIAPSHGETTFAYFLAALAVALFSGSAYEWWCARTGRRSVFTRSTDKTWKSHGFVALCLLLQTLFWLARGQGLMASGMACLTLGGLILTYVAWRVE